MLFTAILKDNSGFMRCYKKGRRVSCDWLCVHFFPNNMPYSRIGITAGKKLGNAVTRNRVKRIIRAYDSYDNKNRVRATTSKGNKVSDR